MKRSLLALLMVLALPATAAAGGFATVGLAPPPATIGPGDTWTAEMTVLQHGQTPLNALRPRPAVIVRAGDAVRSFRAQPTGEPGVYAARVTVPAGAGWTYEVDAFGMVHSFAPVEDRAAAVPDEAGLAAPLAVGLAAGLLAALTVGLVQRRRRDPLPA